MKLQYTLIVLITMIVLTSSAQTYSTLKGQVTFSSEAPEERIDAVNNSVATQFIFDTGKGQVIVPVKSFKFQKALLQEHFNENYLESDQYSKATYKFTISDPGNIDLTKPGKYPVQTRGAFTIKKETKTIEVPGHIVVIDEQTIRMEAQFTIHPADYGISIPKLVERKVANSISITVLSTLNKK